MPCKQHRARLSGYRCRQGLPRSHLGMSCSTMYHCGTMCTKSHPESAPGSAPGRWMCTWSGITQYIYIHTMFAPPTPPAPGCFCIATPRARIRTRTRCRKLRGAHGAQPKTAETTWSGPAALPGASLWPGSAATVARPSRSNRPAQLASDSSRLSRPSRTESASTGRLGGLPRSSRFGAA